MKYLYPCSYRLPRLFIIGGLLLLTGCSIRILPWIGQDCRIRADIDENIQDYIKARYDTSTPKRFAILPFDVPENFYSPGNLPGSINNNLSQELARKLQTALLGTQEFGIIEVFDRQVWQGKRDEFFRGNYSAIEQARYAGYDFLIVGMLEPLVDDHTFKIQTKLIDLSNSATVWSGLTEVSSNARAWDRSFLWLESVKPQPSRFDIRERFDLFATCTANRLAGKTLNQE